MLINAARCNHDLRLNTYAADNTKIARQIIDTLILLDGNNRLSR